MTISLSEHFTFKKLLKFTFPSILTMVFISIYGVVDGLFISNIVGTDAFASVNLVMPFLTIIGGFGSMFGTGGSALISKTLGEGNIPKAKQYFTMILKVTLIAGIIFSILGFCFMEAISYALGATEEMIDDCVNYGGSVVIFSTFLLFQYVFQSFLITAGKPRLNLIVTLIAGISNMILDALFMAVFKWGVIGAGIATGISQMLGGLIPLFYFLFMKNKTALGFAKSKIEFKTIGKISLNGISEMLSTISASITGILYNHQLMSYAGKNGVSAYGVIMYTSFIFIAIFVGYSNGSAPLVSYHYGAENKDEVKGLLKKSLIFVITSGLVMFTLGMLLAPFLAKIFVGSDRNLYQMTLEALHICFFVFIIMGINIYASSFFTALNDGITSGVISFTRSLIFPIILIIVLPLFMKLTGIWLSLLLGEFLSLPVSICYLIFLRKKYQY